MRSQHGRRKIALPLQMLLGLVLGCAVGFLFPHFAATLAPVGTAFVQAIKMIVVPLVFTAITLGIYQMGNLHFHRSRAQCAVPSGPGRELGRSSQARQSHCCKRRLDQVLPRHDPEQHRGGHVG